MIFKKLFHLFGIGALPVSYTHLSVGFAAGLPGVAAAPLFRVVAAPQVGHRLIRRIATPRRIVRSQR